MSRTEALALAQERSLDLIEIAPGAKPPIAKLTNFDKFRYQKEKEFKKQQQSQSKDLKQIQIGLKSARNDLLIRSKRIDEFLKEGYKVEIVMKLRGREKANKEWARGKLVEFLELITESFKTLSEIKPNGSGFSLQIDKSDKKNG
jgi:translation initiation factor IF-3